jgi:hypothetical protein
MLRPICLAREEAHALSDGPDYHTKLSQELSFGVTERAHVIARRAPEVRREARAEKILEKSTEAIPCALGTGGFSREIASSLRSWQ